MIFLEFRCRAAEGQDIAQVINMFNSGLVDQETALEILAHGEVLPEDVDVDEIMSNAENDELKDIEMQVLRTSAMRVGEGTRLEDT